MSIKQPITPERLLEVKFSLQKTAILAHVLMLEHQSVLVDTDFRVPNLNNFANRIGKDCAELSRLVANGGRMRVTSPDADFKLDYSAEIWKVVDLLCGLSLEDIREFTEQLSREVAA